MSQIKLLYSILNDLQDAIEAHDYEMEIYELGNLRESANRSLYPMDANEVPSVLQFIRTMREMSQTEDDTYEQISKIVKENLMDWLWTF